MRPGKQSDHLKSGFLIRLGVKYGGVLGLALLLGACSGQPIGTPRPAAAVVLAPAVPSTIASTLRSIASPTPDCTDTIRATVAIHAFLNNYNTGNLTAILNEVSPSISAYEDGSESFMGTSLTDIQQHLSVMFAKHDHLTAPDASMTVQVETGKMLTDYYATLNQVTRRSDSSTQAATGSIILGLDCATLQVNAIALKTR